MRSESPIRRAATAGAVVLALGTSSAPLLGQRTPLPELSLGAGVVRQPDDNSGLLARTGAHLQGALVMPVGDRAAARVTLYFEHFGVRSSAEPADCDPQTATCPYQPNRLPFALGLASISMTGRSESFGGRLYGGAGAGVHHAFRSPWLGQRTGFAAHAVLGARLGPDEETGLGIEASVHHLVSEHTGTPWLIPIGVTWTF